MSAQEQKANKWLVLLCVGVLGTTGCFTRRPPHATFGRYGTMAPPVVPAAVGTDLDAPPEFDLEPATAPPDVALVRSAPAKPHVAPPPSAEPEKAESPPEPGIAPEFTAQELEAAKTETQHNLDLAEKNLTISFGKSLNATQKDLVSKVHGFADSAREAMKAGDWVRARNLSKKAEVLSEELAAGL